MKEISKIIRAETDEETLEKGKAIKIWDGSRWLVGVIYKRLDQIDTERFSVAEVI